MKLIRMLGLAVVAAIAAMAFAGAGTAMASGTTALCKENVLTCPEAQRYPAGTVLEGLAVNPKLLGTFGGIFTGSVSCEHSVVAGTLDAKQGTPLTGTITSITFTGNCKSTFGGACTVTTVKKGKLDLLWTAANLGTATSLGNEVKVSCGGFPTIECTFGGEPKLHAEGTTNKELTASEAALKVISGSDCPTNPRWDALYKLVKPTGSVFITH
jgi:hypothetical protein